MVTNRQGMLILALGIVTLPGCVQALPWETGTRIDNNKLLAVQEPRPASQNAAGPLNADASTSSTSFPTTAISAKVATVASPETDARPISLAECLALALENGRTGEFFDAAGSDRHTSVTGTGRTLSPSDNSDSVRVFAYDPALLNTEISQSESRFDTIWDTGFNYKRTNELSGILNPSPDDNFLLRDQFDAVGFNTSLLKPLPTGGIAGVTFSTDYLNQAGVPSDQFVNPGYRPEVGIVFEQPLLRGAGVGINQILDSHPGGYRNQIPTNNGAPGIMLARIGHVKSQLEFERGIHEVAFRVEEAYWNLYCAYAELHSRENGIQQAHHAWLVARNKQAAGGLGDADLAMIEEQFHFFRTQRLEALGRGTGGRAGVLEAERHLRYVIGLPAEDGTRLVPTGTPEPVGVNVDWPLAQEEALQNRPELKQIQEDIKAAQLALTKANELLKPDLRLYSKYDFNGLATGLGSSYSNLVNSGRPEWEVGLHMEVPIGFRQGHAEVARARLAIEQQLANLRDQEAKLVFSLVRSYRDLVQFHEEIQTRHSQQEAALKQLKARLEKWNAGGAESVDLILRAQRNWVDSVRDEQVALCSYRIALADFERQKGTILRSRKITIADGQLPACVKPDASLQIRDWFRSADSLFQFGSASTSEPIPSTLQADSETSGQLRKH